MKCRVKNGTIRTGLFSSRIIQMGGRPHIISTIEDISERKAAESAFQTMISSMIGTSGGESLDRITENLAGWLKADCVMIGEIMPGREHVDVLSMVLDGKKIKNFPTLSKGPHAKMPQRKGSVSSPMTWQRSSPEAGTLRSLGSGGMPGHRSGMLKESWSGSSVSCRGSLLFCLILPGR